MNSIEVISTELSKHTTKITELQAKLQQIQTSQKQLEMENTNFERELSFEAGVISSLEFSLNILRQEDTKPQEEDKSDK